MFQRIFLKFYLHIFIDDKKCIENILFRYYITEELPAHSTCGREEKRRFFHVPLFGARLLTLLSIVASGGGRAVFSVIPVVFKIFPHPHTGLL